MKLLSEDETKVTPCDVSVSGTYLNIHGEDYMVLTVYDVTELKMRKGYCLLKENILFLPIN